MIQHAARTALLSALIAAATLVTPAPSPALAADDDVVWGVQPAAPAGPDGRTTFEFQAAPGSVITDWVAVTNHGSAAATFRVYGADATVDYDTGAFTLIGSDRASTGLGAWTAIDGRDAACEGTDAADADAAAEAACAAGLGASVPVAPGATVTLPVTITVPHDATPGDHSAGIVAGFLSEAAGEGASVRREDRVGARIHLRVDGPLSPGLGLTGAVADYSPSWVPFAPGDSTTHFDVVNAGNTRLSVTPSLTLTGPFGIGLGTVSLDPVSDLVPGAKTRVTAQLPGVPPLLLLFAEATLTAVPASGVAAGDPLPAPVSASVVSWAVPWTGLILLLLLAGGAWFLHRRRQLRRQRLAAELADYAERIRAEHAPPPEPMGAGFVPRTRPEGDA